MALADLAAEAVARELSPEHFGHGWRPVVEAEVSPVEEHSPLSYLGGTPRAEVELSIPFSLEDAQNVCPCGEIAVRFDDERLVTTTASAILLEKVLGIEFRGLA